MKNYRLVIALGLLACPSAITAFGAAAPGTPPSPEEEPAPLTQDPPVPVAIQEPEVPFPAPDSPPEPEELGLGERDRSVVLLPVDDTTPDGHFSRLSEEDFREVAEELGVEVAAIKAVVDIEAGKAHKGFYQPGKPIINFDLSMYRKFAPKHGVSLTSARKKAPVIFARPDTRKYGSYQAAQYARLEAPAPSTTRRHWNPPSGGCSRSGDSTGSSADAPRSRSSWRR